MLLLALRYPARGVVLELTVSPKEEEPYTYQTPVDVKLSNFCYADLTRRKNLPTFFKLRPFCKKWLRKPGCCHIMIQSIMFEIR